MSTEPTFEQIDRVAKVIFDAIEGIRWWHGKDEQERNHWRHIARVAILASRDPLQDTE